MQDQMNRSTSQGVLWHSELKIRHCHCSDWVTGSILGLGTSTCHRCSKKKKKKKKKKILLNLKLAWEFRHPVFISRSTSEFSLSISWAQPVFRVACKPLFVRQIKESAQRKQVCRWLLLHQRSRTLADIINVPHNKVP